MRSPEDYIFKDSTTHKHEDEDEDEDESKKDSIQPMKKETTPDWNNTNVETLYNWLVLASYNIMLLEASIKHFRNLINIITLWGLLLSGSTGTISVSQLSQQSNNVIINFLFIFLSYAVTGLTGYLKMYRIQDKLEEFIRVKQEWISFSTSIVSQMQLPIKMRQSAEDIILTNKVKYLELLKLDLDVDESLKKIVSNKITNFYMEIGVYAPVVRPRLTDLIMSVASKELSDSNIKQKLDEHAIDVSNENENKKLPLKNKGPADSSLESHLMDNIKTFGKWAAKEVKEYIEEEISEALEED